MEGENEIYYEWKLFKARSEHYRLRTIALEKQLKLTQNQLKRYKRKLAKARNNHQFELYLLNSQVDALEERIKVIGK